MSERLLQGVEIVVDKGVKDPGWHAFVPLLRLRWMQKDMKAIFSDVHLMS